MGATTLKVPQAPLLFSTFNIVYFINGLDIGADDYLTKPFEI